MKKKTIYKPFDAAAYLDNGTTWQSGTSGTDGPNPTMVVVPAQANKETAMSKATASA